MNEYFILTPSEVLRRTDIDSETKQILGYIATRLNIPNMEWLISKSDVAKQLGMTKPLVSRRFKKLLEMGILSLKTVTTKHGGHLELYSINRPAFSNQFSGSFGVGSNTVLQGSNTVLQGSNAMLPISKIKKKVPEVKNTKLSTKPNNNDLDVFAMLDGIQSEEQKRLANKMDYRNAQANRFQDGKSALDEYYIMNDPKHSKLGL